MMTSRVFPFVVALMMGLGCVGGDPGVDKPEGDEEGKEDAWNYQNDPDRFRIEFVHRLAELPMQGDAENPPWPDDYWSYYNDSINFRWRGQSHPSPAELYDLAFNNWQMPEGYMDLRPRANRATEWDAAYYNQLGPLANDVHRRRGNDRMVNGRDDDNDGEIDECDSENCDGVEFWWGVCHAWAPAAIMEPEPIEAVEHNGQIFYPSDIKALMMINYDSSSAVMLGGRCNARDVARDEDGRATEGDCQDVNAGAFHVVITNMLGRLRRAFAEDRTYDYEVWNQPIRSYEITELRDGLSAAEAMAALGLEGQEYTFNPDAVSFAEVRMNTRYITESHPSEQPRIPQIDRYTRTDRYHYVLELDGNGDIIGGEWGPSSQSNHPDFLWLPTGHRTAFQSITYENVRMLIDMSRGDVEQPVEGEIFATAPNLAIPDNTPAGVVATLDVDSNDLIEDLHVSVDIQHTYIGDLTVALRREGRTVTLQSRQGGSADNLVQDFHVTDFVGEPIGGRWELVVSDHAGQDTGAIRRFALVAQLGENVVVEPEQPGLYTSSTVVEIPDNNAAGVTSAMEITDDVLISDMTVRVHIEHTYVGDLLVELRHNGQVRTLHNHGGGSADNIDASYQISEFNGTSLAGRWELFVSDNAGADTGRIVEWSIVVGATEEPPEEPTNATTLSAPGQVIITELHIDPLGALDREAEWFEIYNTTDSTFDLDGLVVSDDDGDQFTVEGERLIGPGEYMVFGRFDDFAVNGGVPVGYPYGTSMNMANGGDEVILTAGGTVIDRVAWTSSWSVTAGASLQLSAGAYDGAANDDAASWCVSEQEFGTVSDRGTPGLANAACN